MTPPWSTPSLLLAVMAVGEFWLMRGRLSGDASRSADRGSLRLLFAVMALSVTLAWWVARSFPQAGFAQWLGLNAESTAALHALGFTLFASGLGLRWYSVLYLGRLFTYDVAVRPEHHVVDTGPYRFIRHPAYAGSLLSFAGLGLYGGNALGLPVLLAPITAAFLRRIAIEEAALAQALGAPYRDYARRTGRLLPFVY